MKKSLIIYFICGILLVAVSVLALFVFMSSAKIAVNNSKNKAINCLNEKQAASGTDKDRVSVANERICASVQTESNELVNNLKNELSLYRNPLANAESKLFGFKFNQFHKDWECKNSNIVYTSQGIVLNCVQKPCSMAEGAGFPTSVGIAKSSECGDELEKREFPSSILSGFKINISPIYVNESESPYETETYQPNKETPKGRQYYFASIESNNKRETGYSRQYRIVFYSPKTVSDLFSQYTGTYYGTELVYAKYEVIVDVYENPEPEKGLTEKKFLSLMEKMIDSIVFFEK
ncbi:MAG: hypothetical protein ACOZAN_01365 [Patescibacteria group bacterium]